MQRTHFPMWIVGVILAVMLIAISWPRRQQTNLVTVFDRAPTPDVSEILEHPIVSSLGDIGDSLGENGRPIEPAAVPAVSNERVAIYVDDVQRIGSTMQMRGRVENTGQVPFAISVANFAFIDATGVQYGVDGAASDLAPGASEAFEFTVPVPPSRTLTMTLTLDDGGQLLLPIVQAESP
jgi:hypothetical protein